jgi:RsiW-degrading membrane proteinase PrsW (M82 family)
MSVAFDVVLGIVLGFHNEPRPYLKPSARSAETLTARLERALLPVAFNFALVVTLAFALAVALLGRTLLSAAFDFVFAFGFALGLALAFGWQRIRRCDNLPTIQAALAVEAP